MLLRAVSKPGAPQARSLLRLVPIPACLILVQLPSWGLYSSFTRDDN